METMAPKFSFALQSRNMGSQPETSSWQPSLVEDRKPLRSETTHGSAHSS